MRLSESDLSRLEALARIRLEADEKEVLRIQLARIIEFVRGLEDADSDDDSIQEDNLPIPGPLRADELRDCLGRDMVLEQAPDSKAGQFRVPAVIDSEKDVPRK